ncbi:hypothetical protein HK101_005155 [Irineochytrium annulatum]|nr:hypothetical protein HK101_005155 [Irineochytrium annulatum]
MGIRTITRTFFTLPGRRAGPRPSILSANREWDDVALYHPLFHTQPAPTPFSPPPPPTPVHLVGIHPSSILSVHRAINTITTLRPAVVALDADPDQILRYTCKARRLLPRILSQRLHDDQLRIPDAELLTREDRIAIDALDIDEPPTAGLAIGAAVLTASAVGAQIRAVGPDKNWDLRDLSPAERDVVATLRSRYVIPPPQRRRMSALGRIVYAGLLRWHLGPLMRAGRDDGRPGDHRRFLNVYGTFNPVQADRRVRMASAVVVDQVRRLAGAIDGLSADGKEGKAKGKSVVVVLEKDRVVAMHDLWERFVADTQGRVYDRHKVEALEDLVDLMPQVEMVERLIARGIEALDGNADAKSAVVLIKMRERGERLWKMLAPEMTSEQPAGPFELPVVPVDPPEMQIPTARDMMPPQPLPAPPKGRMKEPGLVPVDF